jgi:hypothetical protein
MTVYCSLHTFCYWVVEHQMVFSGERVDEGTEAAVVEPHASVHEQQ